MTTIAMLGAGIMASALTVPLADNGHDVRLVGTHLDRDIIDSVKATRIHPGLQRKLPEAVHAYQLEEAETAVDGTPGLRRFRHLHPAGGEVPVVADGSAPHRRPRSTGCPCTTSSPRQGLT